MTHFLHFADNESGDQGDRLYKVRDLLRMLGENYEALLTPGRDVVIDESMMLWRGRLEFRMYNKFKRSKYGIKLYKLCTKNSNTLRVMIYVGQAGDC